MTNRDIFLQHLQSGPALNEALMFQIYGYELTYPGFQEKALSILKQAGCRDVRSFYTQIVSAYEKTLHDEILEISQWYSKHLQRKRMRSHPAPRIDNHKNPDVRIRQFVCDFYKNNC